MPAKFSSGEMSTWPYSGPPTYSTKLPSSSLRAVRTSSSSSTDSADGHQHVCAGPRWEVLRRTIEEGYQLIPRPLSSKGQGNGRQAADRVQSQQDVIVLQIKHQPGERLGRCEEGAVPSARQ